MSKETSTKDEIYSFICKNPGFSTYEITKDLGMTGGRVRHALIKLEQNGLIKFRFEKNNPRIRKLSFPVDFPKLLPNTLKKEIKKLSF